MNSEYETVPGLQRSTSCCAAPGTRPRIKATTTLPPPANAAMDSPPRFKLTRLFWIGLALLVLGTGPLLAIVLAAELGLLSDPNPNPIGPGLLAFFTFWPAVILIVWGLVASLVRYRRAMQQIGSP